MKPDQAQTELERSVADLAHDLPGMTAKDACARLDYLRRQALLEGFVPAAVLADGLASAITRHGRNIPLGTWIDALTMAAGCGAENEGVGPLLLATIGVRFAA